MKMRQTNRSINHQLRVRAVLELKGKIILVSKIKITNLGKESFDIYFGNASTCSHNTVIVIKSNGESESLPYSESFYTVAGSGVYELEDGSTWEDPDFSAEFIVYKNEDAYQQHSVPQKMPT